MKKIKKQIYITFALCSLLIVALMSIYGYGSVARADELVFDAEAFERDIDVIQYGYRQYGTGTCKCIQRQKRKSGKGTDKARMEAGNLEGFKCKGLQLF